MVFSSATFLFYFLPLALLLYYGALRISLQAANVTLFILSLVLYFWGEREYLVLFIASMVVNYFVAWLLSRATQRRKTVFLVGIALNLGALAFFKYAAFFADLVYGLLGLGSSPEFFRSIRLPLGISFFTFHGVSYLFDVYRGTIVFRPGKVNLGLYIALFPQLIAGPIVRYKEIAHQLEGRAHSRILFSQGIERFIFGLAKKVLLADQLGEFADYAFTLPADQLGTAVAWVGLLAYTLQIYFDFSGYSDMAIGLAKMFGFSFPENFRLPYSARSIRDFWQRWHITLSNWFRDYLYIPLGGNRGSSLQTARNLFVVFFLCGLWHGASWNFVIWGILHGAFISLERGKFGKTIAALPVALQHVYTILIVMLLWVPFRAETLSETLVFMRALVGAAPVSALDPYMFIHFKTKFILALACSILCASGLLSKDTLSRQGLLKPTIAGLLFVLCLAEIAAGSYSPFIYFRF